MLEHLLINPIIAMIKVTLKC
ncbi:hypothetical protein NTG1052_410003 [Candidatus Nitrotoga sp. 1052]|nr:hypothetical protein NTG1052_410003 [Candidatus Nitrotoga sp. 1052]